MTMAKDIMGAGFSGGQVNAVQGNYASFAAAGSTQTDATLVGGVAVAIVTAADGTKGVILPAGQAGDNLVVFNNSGSTLKVYPPVGAAIAVAGTGVGSANAAFSHLTYKAVQYVCGSATQWFAITTA